MITSFLDELNKIKANKPLFDYSGDELQVLDIKKLVASPIKLLRYYEAEEALKKYHTPIVLNGVRRTGKTYVLNQLACEFGTENSLYIYVREYGLSTSELITFINEYNKEKSIDYLFIDEITNIEDIHLRLYQLIDIFTAYGVKMVFSGTLSYLLDLSYCRSENYGRLYPIFFSTVLYKDVYALTGKSFIDFLASGGALLDSDNVVENILLTIEDSLYKTKNWGSGPLAFFTKEDYAIIFEILVERIKEFISYDPANYSVLRFNTRQYNLQCDKMYYRKDRTYKQESVKEFFNILCRMGIIRAVPELCLKAKDDGIHLEDNSPGETRFSIMVHSLFFDLLLGREISLSETDNSKLGDAFETTIISHVIKYTESLKNNVQTVFYKFREREGKSEVDLVVEIRRGLKKSIYLLEMKYNGKKSRNHLFDRDIEAYVQASTGTEVYRYLIYCIGDFDTDRDGYKKINAERFLLNIEEFIK